MSVSLSAGTTQPSRNINRLTITYRRIHGGAPTICTRTADIQQAKQNTNFLLSVIVSSADCA